MPDYAYHRWSRTTPDNRDDYAECDPGVIAAEDGRTAILQWSDGDEDDEDYIYAMIHNRRNVRPLPDAPDPYFKRGR